jgi:hypothetical protein
MRKQVVLHNAIRFVSALALLVSVMTSPIRPNATSGLAHSNHLRRNFGLPGKAPANHRPHLPNPSRVVQIKALSSESTSDFMVHPSPDLIDSPDLVGQPVECTQDPIVFHLDRMSYAPRC